MVFRLMNVVHLRISRYRGYSIELQKVTSRWIVSIRPSRQDLPILPLGTFSLISASESGAMLEAHRRIDHMVARYP
jgi:hypothetical protein